MSKANKNLADDFNKLLSNEFNNALTVEGEVEELKNEIARLRETGEYNITDESIPEDISENTKQIIVLKKNLQRNIWLIGQRLNYILTNKLYINIINEKGLSKYTNFEEYVNYELDFQARTAFNYIEIFKKFQLQPVAVIEYSKLLVISKINSDEEKENLIKKTIEEKLSKRQLEIIVKEYNSLKKVNSKRKVNSKIIKENDKEYRISKLMLSQIGKLDEFNKELKALLEKYISKEPDKKNGSKKTK